MYWTQKSQECSPNWPKSLQNCQNAQIWTINYLVRVAVRGRPPVLQVAVTLLSNLSGDPTQAGGNYDFFFMSIQKGQWKNIVESSVYVIFLSLKFITLSSNRLLIIATSLMLQPLLATPAEKSWIEEVSWAPVSLLSLSWRAKEHIVVYKSWRESYTYSIAYCRLESNLSRKHGYEKYFFLYKLFISFYIIKYNMRHTINTICRLLVGPLCEAGVARIVIWAMTVSPAKHADR